MQRYVPMYRNTRPGGRGTHWDQQVFHTLSSVILSKIELPRQHLPALVLHSEAVCSVALRRIAHERQDHLLASFGAGDSRDGSDIGISMSASNDDSDDTVPATSAATDNQTPHACGSEGGMRLARSSAAPPEGIISGRKEAPPEGIYW